MGTTPWMYGPVEFSAEVDNDVIVVLNVPYRGTIKAINLQEVGGGTAAGEIEIYSSEMIFRHFSLFSAATSSSSSSIAGSSSMSAAAGADPSAYSVTGPLTVAAGKYQNMGLNFGYVNRDGTPTNGVRKLYLRIRTDSAGPFTLTMVIEPADPG